jgi:hypothetical protein
MVTVQQERGVLDASGMTDTKRVEDLLAERQEAQAELYR